MIERVDRKLPPDAWRTTGFRNNHCTVLALTHACGADPDFDPKGFGYVARSIARYLHARTYQNHHDRALRCMEGYFDPSEGSWWGSETIALDLLGLEYVAFNFQRKRPYFAATTLPTVAGIARGMKPGQRAVLRQIGHTSFIDCALNTGVVTTWEAKPRSRVESVYVIRNEADAELNLEAI